MGMLILFGTFCIGMVWMCVMISHKEENPLTAYCLEEKQFYRIHAYLDETNNKQYIVQKKYKLGYYTLPNQPKTQTLEEATVLRDKYIEIDNENKKP